MEHTALCLMEHSWDLIVQSSTMFTQILSLTHVAQLWTLIVTHVSHDPERVPMDTWTYLVTLDPVPLFSKPSTLDTWSI